MVENIELLLGLFILFYLLIILYDVAVQIKLKNEKKIKIRRSDKLFELLILKNNKKLFHYLKKLSYLEAFNDLAVIKGKKGIAKFKGDYEDVFSKLALYYSNRDSLEKAYFAYTISIVKINNKNIIDYLLLILNDKSIYCIENSLIALYNIASVDTIVYAFRILNKSDVLYNNKLITDNLLKYVDFEKKLARSLSENFNEWNNNYMQGFINYFRLIKFDFRDELLELLKVVNEKEIVISIIRYFSKVKDERIVPIISAYLETNYFKDFEYDVVIIQTLSVYKNDKIVQLLKKSLESTNYYVRYNSAVSLSKLCDIRKVSSTDKYAQEMLDYISRGSE